MFITKNEGYIVAFGKAETEVETDEYILLKEVVKSKPTPPIGYDYRLKEDLTWELFELPISEEDVTDGVNTCGCVDTDEPSKYTEVAEEKETLEKQWEEEALAEAVVE